MYVCTRWKCCKRAEPCRGTKSHSNNDNDNDNDNITRTKCFQQPFGTTMCPKGMQQRRSTRSFLTGYLVSSSSSAWRAHGRSSSLHPIGKPLYPMPTIRLSWLTMLVVGGACRFTWAREQGSVHGVARMHTREGLVVLEAAAGATGSSINFTRGQQLQSYLNL